MIGTRRRKAWAEPESGAEEVRTVSAMERGEAAMERAGGGAAAPSPGQADDVANPADEERGVCVNARVLYERLTGRAMRRDPVTRHGRFEWMKDSEEDIGAVERRASGAWLAGGSWKGEMRRCREREERRAMRVTAEQARRFVAFMRQDGRANGGHERQACGGGRGGVRRDRQG